MRPVYITRLSKFLPNEPVSNDEMEGILGKVDGKPSKARALVLRSNGIKTRHYAFRDGKSTHRNIDLAAKAVNGLFDDKLSADKLQLLTAGTGSAEQLVPAHASMVHGELGIQDVEIISTAGACCSSIQGLKYAFLSVGSGMIDCAASVGSEKVSTWMQASRFQPEADNLNRLEEDPYIAFEKDFLRWMLSDGAAAVLLQGQPNADALSLRLDWLEMTSFANELEACMYGGAVKQDDGSLKSWYDMDPGEWLNQSVFSLKQDTRLLGDNIVEKGAEFLKKLMAKHNFGSEDVDYFLPHMSSEFFKQKIKDHLAAVGLDLPAEKWFYNLTRVGNVGSASTFLMLEELYHSGKLKKGERILVMVPESARFSYAYIYLTVV